MSRRLGPGYVLTGLKEKLGGLRVQVETEGADRSALRGVVAAAEAESMCTCEFCGAPGGVRTRKDEPGGWRKDEPGGWRKDEPGGWRKTVCDTCHGAWSAHYLMIIHGAVRDRRG